MHRGGLFFRYYTTKVDYLENLNSFPVSNQINVSGVLRHKYRGNIILEEKDDVCRSEKFLVFLRLKNKQLFL